MGFFGPSKAEVWEQLCAEIGAEYINNGFWKGDRVEARVGEWIIVLDTYTVSTGKTSTTYTRIRAPYINKDGLYFKIYREGFFSAIGKAFGMQDITIGIPEFDENFVIQGNNEERVRQLFSKEVIQHLVEEQPQIHLQVKDSEGFFTSFPEGVDELYFQVVGIIKDVERLRLLFELFAEVLYSLCEMDSASYGDPNVRI